MRRASGTMVPMAIGMKFPALGFALILSGCANTAPYITPAPGADGVLLVDYADSRKDYYLVPAPYNTEHLTEAQKAEALAKATRYCRDNLSDPEVLPLTANKTRNVPAIVFRCIGGSKEF
jgi:hypothetical protein